MSLTYNVYAASSPFLHYKTLCLPISKPACLHYKTLCLPINKPACLLMSNYLQYMHDLSPFLLYKYLCLPISKPAFLQMPLPLMQIPLHFCTSRLCACTFLCLSTSKSVIFPTSIPLHDSLHICGSASTSLFLPAGFSACQYICLPACACISLLACRRSFLSKRLNRSVYFSMYFSFSVYYAQVYFVL